MNKYQSFNLIFILTSLLIIGSCTAPSLDGENQYQSFAPDGIPFAVADSAWDVDGTGNHRAVVSVKQPESGRDAVIATLPWRRPDRQPETKKIVVVDATTGREIQNVSVIDLSAEKGVIAFQPATVPGDYYIYYMPYKFRKAHGDARYGKPWNDYLPAEYATDAGWEKRVKDNLSAMKPILPERFETR
ncbi:MAG: DUF6067 family protein, partial [Tannerella sp.]|nr:DUF6067 family protein [Tannerella sp.]